MNIQDTRMTIADYCKSFERGEIVVNRDYQRSDAVWPPAARSFLIETILLGYPVPKLSLHQVTDLKSRTTIKEIVDGQQRTTAIYDFYQDKLRLSRTIELGGAAGKRYSELDEELQHQFLDYGLVFDLFIGVNNDQVREIFRRMNSFTVPLNAEEQRHANYQGPFKWVVHRLARDYDKPFETAGVFTAKQFVRMADAKLLTEVIHGALNGITTTTRKSLDDLYKEFDREFPDEEQVDLRVRAALDRVLAWEQFHDTALMKTYEFYSLVLAVMHAQEPLSALLPIADAVDLIDLDSEQVTYNLSVLAEELDKDLDDDERKQSPFADFLVASSEGTNVADARMVRFRWFYKALTHPNL